jgi:hypothetical protein
MKYAIIGPRGRVFKVLDQQTPSSIEISDEIASQIANTQNAMLINGVVTNHQLEKEAGFNLKWNEENKSWERIPIIKPVPQSITATQIRLWLIKNNITMNMVYATIDNISDPKIKEEVSVLWEYAPYIERNNPFVSMIGQAFGLNNDQIDQAFREAKVIL